LKRMLSVLALMGGFSIVLLLGLSVLTYIFKWKADTALVGITFCYIAVGFFGGKVKAIWSYETGVGRKLIDGLVIGNLFMLCLLAVSTFLIVNEFLLESRFFMIWMLIMGSTALGRIL